MLYQLAISFETLAKKCLSYSSVAICDKRFSKQNAIKSHLQGSLKLNTLDVFYASIIMLYNGGEYRLEGNI